jgi:hypothetical protein
VIAVARSQRQQCVAPVVIYLSAAHNYFVGWVILAETPR